MSARLTDQERLYRATPESAVVRAVIEQFNARGGMAWRNNTGGARFRNAGSDTEYFVRFSVPGASDVFGIFGGVFYVIECKRETGKRTDAQIAWQAAIVAHGGVALVCRPSTYVDVLDMAIGAL